MWLGLEMSFGFPLVLLCFCLGGVRVAVFDRLTGVWLLWLSFGVGVVGCSWVAFGCWCLRLRLDCLRVCVWLIGWLG